MLTNEELLSALKDEAVFPQPGTGGVIVHETHISWIFLVGDYAYKVKKSIHNDFLDYRSLKARQRFCHEELRLGSRFAKNLYVEVVPIAFENGHVRVEGQGKPVEFAVKMHRFPSNSLLSLQLEEGNVQATDIVQLAETIARTHIQAPVCHPRVANSLHQTLRDAVDNLCALQPQVGGSLAGNLRQLQHWTRDTFETHENKFAARIANGFIRECHGDLHSGNIVRWQGEWMPFDGIEFNDDFRLIDVLNDSAFLIMDLSARGRDDLAYLFTNAYVERTADRSSLALLRWYTVYRALVRAKVASMRAEQLDEGQSEFAAVVNERDDYIRLAQRLADSRPPQLSITHGVSGSGKSTISAQIVARQGAIRVRSDVERKRLLQSDLSVHPDGRKKDELYSDEATRRTYAQLLSIAEELLTAGYSVVLDAAFLKLLHRRAAHGLARRLGVDFNIIDCVADRQTLRERLIERAKTNSDVSDADVNVLEAQYVSQEPLTESERPFVVGTGLVGGV